MANVHTCEAAVLHCIDFRFRRILNTYLSWKLAEGYDLVSVAGGVQRLVSDPLDSNFVLEQLKISCRLHEPKAIILIQHEDCGAYGGSRNFKSSIAEEEYQKGQLSRAKSLLKEQFSQCEVELYFVRLSGEMISIPSV